MGELLFGTDERRECRRIEGGTLMDWGVPDWTNGAAYPSTLTMREWWWQFTRRRPDYRALWTKWAPINGARINRKRDMYEQLAARQSDTIELFLDRAPTDDPDGL